MWFVGNFLQLLPSLKDAISNMLNDELAKKMKTWGSRVEGRKPMSGWRSKTIFWETWVQRKAQSSLNKSWPDLARRKKLKEGGDNQPIILRCLDGLL